VLPCAVLQAEKGKREVELPSPRRGREGERESQFRMFQVQIKRTEEVICAWRFLRFSSLDPNYSFDDKLTRSGTRLSVRVSVMRSDAERG